MAKMHQLLAVEGDLKNTYLKILNETVATFTKKQEHFKGFIRELDLFDSAAPTPPVERASMQTTVRSKLDYQAAHITRYLDAALQKETTNQTAVADIVVNGKVILQGVAATFLLGLEKELKRIRVVYETIPTLPPKIEWTADPDTGKGVYRRKYPEEKFKTEQTIVPQILYEATEHHPAQVDKISEVKNVGKYIRNEWCSMLTSGEKANLLHKIDELTIAVKKARQKANNTEVVKTNIGEKLFNFIHG